MTRWRATYRIQLRSGTRLRDVRRLVPYLYRLGVSHLYLSPLLHARRASAHGYDVIDPTRLDPALGRERDLERLAAAARGAGLGVLLDIVPNHMAADPEGPAFDDLLRRGAAARHARWFDVDWGEGDAPARLVLPVLGAPLATCLSRGELRLVREGGEPRIRYADRSFPIDPTTWPAAARAASGRGGAALEAALRGFGAGAAGRRRLARLLSRQPYRLCHWRTGRRVLNYRRFFDVNELIALRAEDPEVFAATHAKLLDWVAGGWVQGLRIDHVDGLLDPEGYLVRLRRALRARLAPRAEFALLVEKILAPDEALPASWPVDGTTGYEALNQIEAALIEPAGASRIEAFWSGWSGLAPDFAATARAARRRVLDELFEADLARLARALGRLPQARGVPEPALRRALAETLAALRVYRVYPSPRGLLLEERRRLAAALAGARRAPARAVEGLARVLLARPAGAGDPRLEFSRRFQQLAGPVAAKGVEDTALYVHVPLTSRNEVGGDPGMPLGSAPDALHAANAGRRRTPRTLLAASTHDTKRSADVRARIDVLSEVPDLWCDALRRWRRAHAPLRGRVGRLRVPDANTEYLLYQTLVGIWPQTGPAGAAPDRRARAVLAVRVEDYLRKAVREAKIHSSWIEPDERFEAWLGRFVRALLLEGGSGSPGAAFRRDLTRLVAEVARPGLWNSLSRTLVQLASPGIPDLYQGDELFCFSLVDPDNRGPVDFAERRRRLRQVEAGFAGARLRRERFLREIVGRPEDGRVKLHLIRAALGARRRRPDLFERGGYQPLRARGPRARHVFAFARRAGGRVAVVVAPRLARTLVGGAEPPLGDGAWGETSLTLPRSRGYACALSGARVRGGRVRVGALLAAFPAALLLG